MNDMTTETHSEKTPPLLTAGGHPVVDPQAKASGKSQDQSFDELLSNFISTFILHQDYRFFVNEQAVPAEILAGNKVMLAPILWQAEKTHYLLCGKSMGAIFRSDPEASVGAVAVVENIPGHARSSYTIFCVEVLVHALENFTLDDTNSPIGSAEVRENILKGDRLPPRGAACSLDHLVQGFMLDHDLGLVPWTTNSDPQAPNLGDLSSQQGSSMDSGSASPVFLDAKEFAGGRGATSTPAGNNAAPPG